MRIGISIGDPNGIGPEISLKAAATRPSEVVLIGDGDLLRREADRLSLPLPPLYAPMASPHFVPQPGQTAADAGAASASWVEAGITACLRGELDALVTAPISKEAWNRAGIPFPGHTELLADRCGTRRFGMLLAGKQLRVILATRHIPLRCVADQLCEADIRLAVELLCEGLPLLGVATPSIAICGLNPHAGDGGAIGDEEQRWIGPLLSRMATEEGLPVSGPHPADTVFHRAVQGEFDAIVALYHDQGLAPLKLHAFDQGVNLTLGLPIYRTSPDHGTAFGIAGRGLARPDSMIAALETARQLAGQANPWKPPST